MWKTWAGFAVGAGQVVTAVTSTSREPHRPSVAANMLAGASAVSTGFSGCGESSSRATTGLGLGHPLGFLLRQQLLFGLLDVDDVGGDDPLGVALAVIASPVEPQRLVAEVLDQVQRVRDQQDRLVAAAELGELVQALHGEALVADRQHFVDQQHVGIDVDRHREAEPHVHARRVGLDRRVDEVLQLGELDDLVEALLDLALRQAEHDAVDEDVLAAGDLGVEAGAELDQRRDAAVDRRPLPVVGRVIPATHLSSVLLPEPLRPMTP